MPLFTKEQVKLFTQICQDLDPIPDGIFLKSSQVSALRFLVDNLKLDRDITLTEECDIPKFVKLGLVETVGSSRNVSGWRVRSQNYQALIDLLKPYDNHITFNIGSYRSGFESTSYSLPSCKAHIEYFAKKMGVKKDNLWTS